MNDTLATYLHDHLAGSHVATQLLESLQEQYRDEPLGAFALAMAADVKQDQDLLQAIIDHVGHAHMDLAAATGWLVEMASRLKLRRDESGAGLGTFEALETLALGIQGKLSLWKILPRVREFDARIPEYDFDRLAARAQEQYGRAEEQRARLVRSTFHRAPQ
jgi:hypothetical protein